MSDTEKPLWQQDYDDAEWKQETVERLFLAFLNELRAPLAGLEGSVKMLRPIPPDLEDHLVLSAYRLKNLNDLLYQTIDYVNKRIEAEHRD